MKTKKIGRAIFISLFGAFFLMCIGMGVYLSDYSHSKHTLAEYQKEAEVTIIQEGSLITVEGQEPNGTGIILYPGGKVEYTAYVPLLEKIAEQGYTCYLPKMPGNLAVFGQKKAEKIIKEHGDIQTWYIAGHSLGGAMASVYASEHDRQLEGIILLGSYASSDLSDTKLRMLSIVGSNDKVVNQENYEKNKALAPKDVTYRIIEGGNHGNFGDYGPQDGDGKATISNEEQMTQTAGYIREFCSSGE